MKGQYFSFDAIVAAIIMVAAFTMLFSYWFSMQYAVESRTLDLQANAMRIAESLFTPGTPADWATHGNLNDARQIGLATNYSNSLSKQKIEGLMHFYLSQPQDVLNLLRSPANCQITILQSDTSIIGVPDVGPYIIGQAPLANATDVAIAHRGGTLEGHPVQVTVIIWR